MMNFFLFDHHAKLVEILWLNRHQKESDGRCSLLGTKLIEMNGSAMDRVFSEILWIDDSQYSLAFFYGTIVFYFYY